ncbi:YjaG family protein [Marinobacter sp. 1-3A]|uniref:YjaG family protein n=1 Tax=Marinobacter sp. 1-3A TaxID=2582920 RepID=UPI0019049B16|nr:YjaG family protein [Marinobacter sp. 1-3A]MBK1874347.1 YjaG family protein [Marinobacter sp. 1-3A]
MNANQFLKAVAQLQGWRECAFLLALAERSFPNYALFAEAVDLKTGGKMHQILDLAWGTLQEDVAESAIPQLLVKLEALSPDVDAYDAYGVYPAFDFCQLLEQALLNRLNPSKHRATEASQLATNTVMSFIELSEGEGLEEYELVRLLDSHPLMKEDKAFQRNLVLGLKRQRTPVEQFIAEIREIAANEGISNLGISPGD